MQASPENYEHAGGQVCGKTTHDDLAGTGICCRFFQLPFVPALALTHKPLVEPLTPHLDGAALPPDATMDLQNATPIGEADSYERSVLVTKRNQIVAITVLVLFAAAYAFRRWHNTGDERATLLAALPASATSVIYANVKELRQSRFAAELYAWAPRNSVDAEYADFLRQTGFDYELDLGQIAIAVLRQPEGSAIFVIATGRFDRKKIDAYAARSGAQQNRNGHDIFSVPVNNGQQRIAFTFLRPDRVALTDEPDLNALLSQRATGDDARQWRERFERLAGSPIFAVVRQDAAAGSALESRAPGGMQSPELSALLDQLQWISLAGKPEDDRLRVVIEGESASDSAAKQLTEVLGTLILLAQTGLNGPATRQQLDPSAREAYLELLKNADVSRIDRGDTKAVRLMFEVTPRLLDSARTSVPLPPAAAKPQPERQHPANPRDANKRPKGR